MSQPEHSPLAKQETIHVPPPKRDAGGENAGRVVAAAFAGPLPPPDVLSRYESAFPGSANRIITMAEEEARHRREMEAQIVSAGQREIQHEFAEARLGQVFALVTTLAAISAAWHLGMNGHEIAGGIIGVGGIGSVVTTFVLGRAGGTKRDKSQPPDETDTRKKVAEPAVPKRKR